jgi:hypothetical protein
MRELREQRKQTKLIFAFSTQSEKAKQTPSRYEFRLNVSYLISKRI